MFVVGPPQNKYAVARVYPWPGDVTVTPVICSPIESNSAIATAPTPSPSMTTDGAATYPLRGADGNSIEAMPPPTGLLSGVDIVLDTPDGTSNTAPPEYTVASTASLPAPSSSPAEMAEIPPPLNETDAVVVSWIS